MYLYVTIWEDHMIEESLHKIQQRMADAMASVGRTDTALLVAVTKNHPVTAVEEVARLGCTHVGENRVQEAKEKQFSSVILSVPPIQICSLGTPRCNTSSSINRHKSTCGVAFDAPSLMIYRTNSSLLASVIFFHSSVKVSASS